MKTLSIQQPWASLVCAGIKDVENRTWKPAQVPGRILIHASSKKVTKNFFASIPEYLVSFINNDIGFGNLPELDTLPTSAIIGYVTVTGFEEGEVDSIWSDGPGVIKWKLEDAWLFDEPILNVKGKLNLFDYDEIDENNLPPAHQVELTDVDINFIGTTGTSIQILHNGAINYVDNQDFVVPLGVTLDINYGKIN